MADFTDEFKVSIIADATSVDQKIRESTAKLEVFKAKANQQAQIKLRVTIAELDSKLADARRQLAQFRKDGDKQAEIKVRLDIQGLQQNKTNASKLLRDLQSDTNQTTKSFFSLNGIVKDGLKAFGGFFIIRQFTGALKSAFDASVSFESAFAGIKKTVDASTQEFAALESQFRNLAKEIPLSVEGLSRIGELAGQLGIAKEDIIDFTKTIAAIGVSTNLTEEEAATSFARIANIFQIPAAKIQNLASSVVALGNNFATTEAEIVNFATNAATAGKIAGLTTADVAAIAAAFTSVGIEAEAGGTAVSKTLQAITDAVSEGGQKLTDFASVSGMSADKFSKLWRADPVQAFNSFIKGLGQSGEKGSAILEDLVGGDARLKKAFLGVAAAGDLLTRAIDTSSTAFAANTALTSEAEKRYATTESQLALINNRWNDIKISVGNFLKEVGVPVLDFFVSLAEALGGASNGLSALADAIKVAGVLLASAFSVSILKKIDTGLQAIILNAKLMKIAFSEASATGGLFSGVLASLRIAFGALLGPAALATAAVAGIALVWFNTRKNAEELKISTASLKKTLDGFAKIPSLEPINKQFQSLLDKTHATEAQLGKLASQMDFSGFNEASVGFSKDLQSMRGETVLLLQSLGMTGPEIEDFTKKLDFFGSEVSATKEDQDLLNKKVEEGSPAITSLAADYAASVNRIKDKTGDWGQAIATVTEANRTQFKKNGQNAEIMTKEMEDIYIANIAKSDDLGTAALLAYERGYNNSSTRSTLEKGVGVVTDQMLNVELAAAVKSGDNGKAAGLLWAMGIIDTKNEFEAIKSAKNLNAAVINAFENRKAEIYQSGKNSGGSVVGGIIAGIIEKIPALAGILEKVVKSLGAFSSVGNAFKPLANQFPVFSALFSDMTVNVGTLEKSYKDLLTVGKEPVFKGGGGSGKGLDEAEKKAKDAEKAVDDFTKSVEDNNKASRKLRDDLKEFYQDIVNSIEAARAKQEELRNELSTFKKEEQAGFAKSTAKQDVDLAKEQLDLEKQLADTKKEATDNSDDEIKKQEKIAEIQTELNGVLAERKQIQDFLSSLTADGTAESKVVLDQFTEARRRATLTEFEQNKLELEDKIKEKEDEVNAEIAKQQKIIDIQNRFLELQNATDAASLDKKKKLMDLATGDTVMTEAERQAKLKELGFEGLTQDQELALIKQVQTGNSLEVEKKQIEDQQASILATKQQYFDLAEQYHGESVDRMKTKTEELIALIQQAVIEQERLTALSGAANTASNSVGATTNLNITQNNSSNVDVDAALNSVLNKVK